MQCVEHDPEGAQAGPLIEQLLIETMGRDFLMSSFIAIISNKHNMPLKICQSKRLGVEPFIEFERWCFNTDEVITGSTIHY